MPRLPSLSVWLFLCLVGFSSQVLAQTPLSVARYTESGQLDFPVDTDLWVFMGSTLGGDYNDTPFDPAAPATFGIVQMEPAAYRHYMENGEYADGTMFLLSFYNSESKSQPQLQGFVQGALRDQEIHVIDKARFAEGRGFFFYRGGGTATRTAAKIPDGSDCVSCHNEHAARDGIFSQFYPVLKNR